MAEAIAVYEDTLRTLVDQVIKQRESCDLVGAKRRGKISFLDRLPSSTIAVFYPSNQMHLISANSRVFKSIAVCNCEALPFTHFYLLTPNDREQSRKTNESRWICPALSPVRQGPLALQNSLLLSRPDILALVNPDHRENAKMVSAKGGRKGTRHGGAANSEILVDCPVCQKPVATTPTSVDSSLKGGRDYRCRSCSSRHSRTINYERRTKVSEVPELLATFADPFADPSRISIGSSDKYLWRCPFCEDTYEAEPRRRIFVTNCRSCGHGTSLPERILYLTLGCVLADSDGQTFHRPSLKPGSDGRIEEPDILFKLNEEAWVVEYDGEHWHKNKLERDEKKTLRLVKHGYSVVRFREKRLPNLEAQPSVWCFSVPAHGDNEWVLGAMDQLSSLNVEFLHHWTTFKNRHSDAEAMMEFLRREWLKYDVWNFRLSTDEKTFHQRNLLTEFPGINRVWARKTVNQNSTFTTPAMGPFSHSTTRFFSIWPLFVRTSANPNQNPSQYTTYSRLGDTANPLSVATATGWI